MLNGLISSLESPSNSPTHQMKLKLGKNIIKGHREMRTFKFIEYFPITFRNIRSISQITDEILQTSLNPDLNKNKLVQVKEGEGKSGSFFFTSFDQRFKIKIIQQEEKNQITRMLEDIEKHFRRNPNSLLTRIYSLFKIKVRGMASVHAILIPNSFFIDGKVRVNIIYLMYVYLN